MPEIQSLMSIATNSKLRIRERIKQIKGEDKKISSSEEAKAIFAIPPSDVLWSDDKNELPLARMDAMYYMQYGDRNLRDDLADAVKYIKNKGTILLAKISNYFQSDNGAVVAKNSK